VLERHLLNAINEGSAGELASIRVVTSLASLAVAGSATVLESVSVRLYARYYHQAEKSIGSYLIREGGSVRPAELTALGIEPFEIRGVRAVPRVIKPGDKPVVRNGTQWLEIVRVEKNFSRYEVTLKNGYAKNVINFAIAFANGFTYRNLLDTAQPGGLAPGAVAKFDVGYGTEMDEEFTIAAVIMADGSADGDPKICAHILATYMGASLAATRSMARIQPLLDGSDEELDTKLERLEAELASLPEAIEPETGIGIVKSRFRSFDDRLIGLLFVDLKVGYRAARDTALSTVKNLRISTLDRGAQRATGEQSEAVEIRKRLTALEDQLQAMIAAW
jgi:hypothetical protein